MVRDDIISDVRDSGKQVVDLRLVGCDKNRTVKDGKLFSEPVESPVDQKIVGDPELYETPVNVHSMLMNIVPPYASVDNPTFNIQINGEGV